MGGEGKRSLPKGTLRRPLPPFQLALQTPRLTWERYGNGGLLREQVDPQDPASWVWHGGHVTALLDSGPAGTGGQPGAVLVGTHTGGLHRLQFAPTLTAEPLSDTCDNPDVSCLAHGPDGDDHVYAGCRHVAFVREMLYESPPDGGDWRPIATIDDGFGAVFAIGVVTLSGPPILDRRIICATAAGVFWSPIPGPNDAARQYHWQQAAWPAGVSPRACSGLVTFGSTVVVAGRDATVWKGSLRRFVLDLTLTKATAPAVTDSGLTSLAGSADGARLYCLAGGGAKGNVVGLLVSDDLGSSWHTTDPKVDRLDGVAQTADSLLTNGALAGVNGNAWNNALAVAPRDRLRVAAGWQFGLFFSTDGGATFAKRTNDSNKGRTPIVHQHLHEDIHALFFDPRDPAGETLFIGSDGGLAVTQSASSAFAAPANRFSSRANSVLSNLQVQSLPEREFYGTMSPSPKVAGLIAVGLQDNADAWRTGTGSWRQVGYGDGAGVLFCANGMLLFDVQNAVQVTTWNGSSFQGGTVVPFEFDDGTREPRGFANPAMDAVHAPAFQRDGQLLYAIGGGGGTAGLAKDETGVGANQLFGLYADADAGNARWRPLPDLPASETAWVFASSDGNRIYCGSTSGSQASQAAFVHSIDSARNTITQLGTIPPIIDGQADEQAAIGHLAIHTDGTLLAGYNALLSTRDGYGGQVIAWTDATGAWRRLAGHDQLWPSHGIFGLAVDDWGVCYATTDDSVYTAPRPTGPWQLNSGGLVRRAHLGHIRFVRYPNGGVELFASTFGRGTWRARWTRSSGRRQLPTGPVAFNQLVGSLVDGKLFTVGPHGLQPVGPIDPDLEANVRSEFADLLTVADRLGTVLSSAGAEGTADLDEWSALRNALDRSLDTLTNASAASTPGAQRLDLVGPATDSLRTAAQGLAQLAKSGGLSLRRGGVQATTAESITTSSLALSARVDQLEQLTARIR